jgi:hypothetical protein
LKYFTFMAEFRTIKKYGLITVIYLFLVFLGLVGEMFP